MNTLIRSCAVLWLVGLVGMSLARTVFELEPHAPFFRIAGALWILGGIGYTSLGVLGLVACARAAAPVRNMASADLSALIRRR